MQVIASVQLLFLRVPCQCLVVGPGSAGQQAKRKAEFGVQRDKDKLETVDTLHLHATVSDCEKTFRK